MIIVKTPMRVSLFGGGTDYPSYYNEHGGSVLGMAVDKYCWITLRRLPPFFETHHHRIVYSKIELVKEIKEIQHPAVRAILGNTVAVQGLEIHHDADLPARSGMGSSSAFTVGMLNGLAALNGTMLTKRALAQSAIAMEQDVIGENVGSQDQVWAAYGGLNRIDFRNGGFSVLPLIVSAERRRELTSSVVLYFTGLSRDASEVSAAQMERVSINVTNLHKLKDMVDAAWEILCDPLRPMSDLGHLLNEAWHVKRGLSPNITNGDIDALYQAGMGAGAWGGKLLGAGSGGFMLFMVERNRREALRQAMAGRIEIDIDIDEDGSKVVLYQPNGL